MGKVEIFNFVDQKFQQWKILKKIIKYLVKKTLSGYKG